MSDFMMDIQMSPLLKEKFSRILLCLVDSHIRLSRPISSIFITGQYRMNLSSSSVRAAFVKLEEQGYLFSPHQSSGRVPTVKAYRYYVNHIPRIVKPKKEDCKYAQIQYLKHGSDYRSILNTTAKILSRLTRYPSIISATQNSMASVKHIECIHIGTHEVLIVLLTRDEETYAHHLHLEKSVTEREVKEISYRLNRGIKGIITDELPEKLKQMAREIDQEIFQELLEKLSRKMSIEGKSNQMYSHGIRKLATIKENNIFNLLESRLLEQIMNSSRNSKAVQILISDQQKKIANDISIVCGSYFFGDKAGGSIGVIGPTNMNYSHTIGAVEYMRILLSAMLTKKSN